MGLEGDASEKGAPELSRKAIVKMIEESMVMVHFLYVILYPRLVSRAKIPPSEMTSCRCVCEACWRKQSSCEEFGQNSREHRLALVVENNRAA